MASQEETDTKYCSNCKRDIASVNFVMHEVHCRRNIVLCKHCQEPVPKGEQDEHYEEYHAKVKCEKCNQTLEKSAVDDHKDECPKRTAHCSYCELDMPFCDLKGHMEYCGTRTEQCELCQQYIMIKDMIKHTDMGCKYPNNDTNNSAQNRTSNTTQNRTNNSGASTSQVRPNNTTANGVTQPRNYGAMNDVYSNFAMDEITRMMGGSGIDAAGPSSRPQPRNHASSTSTTNKRLPITKNFHRANKRTNEISGGRSRTNEISGGRNQNYGANLNASSGDTFENDRLLAMALAQDLGHDAADFNTQPIANEGDFDDVSIPCEFCGEPFPIDRLIVHQTSCNPDVNGGSISPDRSIHPHVQESTITRSSGANNESRSRSPIANNVRDAQRSSNQPPVLNNLQYAAAEEMYSTPPMESSLSPSDVLLPCEFCDDLFPEDFIIQHQSVCDANRTSTPRTRTPVATRSTIRSYANPTTKRTNNQGVSGYTPTRKTNNTTRTQQAQKYGLKSVTNGSLFNPVANTRNGGLGRNPSEYKRATPSTRPKNFAPRRNPANMGGGVAAGGGAENADPDVDMDRLISDPNATTDDLLNQLDRNDRANRRVSSRESAASNGVKSSKPRVPSSRRQNDVAGSSSYQASFASAYTSKKPKPVKNSSFQSDLNDASLLRVGPSQSPGSGSSTGARGNTGSSAQGRYVNTKKNNTSTNSRPRRHPQGDV